jgi:thioesterase domain-containing protein
MSHVTHTLQQRLEDHLLHSIPLARAMALQVEAASAERVVLRAPLGPNSNDKGCAFGGSLASLLTLASWSLLRVHTWQRNWSVDIFVHKSELLYIAPIWQDFRVVASLSAEAIARFDADFLATAKAAALTNAEAFCSDASGTTLCATRMSARFVALRSAAGDEAAA